ncbi:MAG: hypothetical protein IJ264_07230, partial [Clostridia bacterium]|nr:hypothetical protein [Clostridia bacterium]
MKRLIGIIICAAMIVSCCSVGVSANEKDDDPIILISGFLCSQLFMNYGAENEEKVWVMAPSRITDKIGDDLPRLLKTFAGFAVGNTEDFGKTLGEGAGDVLENLRCNPDGSSVYPISHYPNDPAVSSIKYMIDNGEEDKLYEKKFCKHLASLADASNIYCFQYDSRFDAITNADLLNDFIEKVKEYTGSDKVRIFALSFGGLISVSYLYLYGDSSISKLIMSVPAIGGTNIPDRLFRGKIDFPAEDIVSFFETILGGESDIARLFEKTELEKTSAVISSAADGICEPLMYWGSIWSLCSADLYDELKKDFLDPVKNKELIEKTDKVHYEIMPAVPQLLRKAQANGVDVAILCASGSNLVTGGGLNGDVILPAYAVSGATCAPMGQRFANGYSAVKTACSDQGHNHVSPSMEIDASSAYLPENTWFIDGQYHGQYYYEEYTRSLVTKLLLTDEIKDVYSDPSYPQFECSNHSNRNLHVKFNRSKTGYLSSEDTALVIKNISADNTVKVLSVLSDGVELCFDASESGMLSPGETVEIPFEGDVPKVGATAAQITVSYIEIGSINPFCTSDFDIMIDNGGAAAAVQEFAPAGFESRLEASLSERVYNFIVRFSLRQFVECIYNS